ncbi:hypothetical protein [Streptomyces paludis]|uniref:Uncharacterized protein n=1 Tax=Streptomyces paludis TaxID=2282738 RepID=A0A345HWR0_9ACTN|nr:hypothetical protein [Streptomyces paludis]AXG81134.1 hypothetical protein DVK44_29475 [Streptomyces paludis]
MTMLAHHAFIPSAPEEPPLTPEEEEEAPEGAEPCGRPTSLAGPCSAGDWCCKGPVTAASPQPVRRPPYAVAYAVDGALYEVAVPGDAIVTAVDGALTIKHASGHVAGITGVYPIEYKTED